MDSHETILESIYGWYRPLAERRPHQSSTRRPGATRPGRQPQQERRDRGNGPGAAARRGNGEIVTFVEGRSTGACKAALTLRLTAPADPTIITATLKLDGHSELLRWQAELVVDWLKGRQRASAGLRASGRRPKSRTRRRR